MTTELSVVIPAWNEAKRISRTLDEIARTLSDMAFEIIVVDDGSSDGTSEVVAAWAKEHASCLVSLLRVNHAGKGGAIQAGILHSQGELVSFIDADLEIQPSELRKLVMVSKHEQVEVVVGTKQSSNWMQQPSHELKRKIISKTFCWVNQMLLDLQVKDTQTGCKVFPGEWMRNNILRVKTQGYLFDLEILAYAQQAQLGVREIPIEVHPDGNKKNRILWKDLWVSAWEYIKILNRIKQVEPSFERKEARHAHIDA